jgi:hypothetical protein
MMGTRGLYVAAVAIGLFVASAHESAAQPSITVSSPRFTIGGLLGSSANGDTNSGRTGVDFAAFVEQPVSDIWRVRADVGRVGWAFEDAGVSPSRSVHDTVDITRVTVGAVKSAQPFSSSINAYLGGGLGAYRYGFRRDGAKVTKIGVHGVGGLEFVLDDERLAIGGELQVHSIRGPSRRPVFAYYLWVVSASVSVKVRL